MCTRCILFGLYKGSDPSLLAENEVIIVRDTEIQFLTEHQLVESGSQASVSIQLLHVYLEKWEWEKGRGEGEQGEEVRSMIEEWTRGTKS